jgi:hypothetical protein
MANDRILESAQLPEAHKKTCFVVAPIGEDGTETRKRSDQVLKHIIRKALEPTYKVERADEIDKPGTITVQVVQRVFDADLVVADLSERNANVFYELAIRHATKKPSVHLFNSDEEIPFDVNQIRAIEFDLSNPDSIEAAQTRLRKQVEAIEKGEQVLTPVQFAQILRTLEAGEGRDKLIFELLKGMAEGISSIKTQIAPIVRDGLVKRLAGRLVDVRGPSDFIASLVSDAIAERRTSVHLADVVPGGEKGKEPK